MNSTQLTAAPKRKILIVDDDPDLLRLLSIRLESANFEVESADSAEAAIKFVSMERPQLVITDMRMQGMDGIALFERIHRSVPTLPVIMLTAHGTIPDAVNAMQRGLFGYLTKPFDSAVLLEHVERAFQFIPAALRNPETGDWRADIITQSPVMEDVLTKARLVAEGDASVLIRGGSGTGKELLAHAIHNASHRSQRPFVAINCAAIPELLLESELFGHTKGAFTGAVRDHKGLFQSAIGGTVFLDEIGDMPLALQSKLLRVLQEKQVTPVGSTQTVPLDVRIISATHRDLKEEIVAGKFREDIYYRLNVVELVIPPLSERREDIPLLSKYFLSMLSGKYNRKINGFSPDAMNKLIEAPWPGNVRQLQNVVEQSVVLCTTSLISSVLVQNTIHIEAEMFVSLEEGKNRFERDYLIRILKITEGNVTQAAKLSKRNRTEFYKLLQKHQITPSLIRQLP
ncbi:sigma-54-dependent transcriptional regulator [Gallionella capsiferriformans]|uniref:Putative two component, sigma54 specific, transcriptional regulator, Fis family n=1 Tax=Gallionella capsiferriformans (strain ES-2) TaxID=395494 RepID=D9SGM5_GALCS|nr:sigma 54-interacting transcriptional regulator [Gallionella capsiferriformans]ADL55672.1 putative two component, sigma54 specific, transcriptional regulator, Fis family [Gallionella capsiferriformans ES-2]